jgi:hypothetical protein
MDVAGGGQGPQLGLVEAVLEAWAECEPQGFVLPERRAVALLFTLGAHLPGGNEKGLGGRAHKLEALVPLLSGAAAGDLPKGAIVLPARDGWRCPNRRVCRSRQGVAWMR